MAKYNVVTNVVITSSQEDREAKLLRMALEATPACMYCPAAEDLITHTYMRCPGRDRRIDEIDKIDKIDAELMDMMRQFEEMD